jgi:hypothetical protein
MMAVEISPETTVMVEAPIPIRLPKWLWTIVYARAKALYGGDLECCVNQLLQTGIQVEIKVLGAVGPEGGN